MRSGLEHLLAEGVISEVLARLQSGKEAEVYVVRFGGNVVAAKVYKDRAQRSFKNNALYKEGRSVRNSRSQRAIDRGSSFGKAAAEDAWKTAEADALYKLHAAEVRVPTPVLYLDGVLLMELVLDGEGNAARRLIDTDLTPADAHRAYHDMIGQLVRILSCDLIHGDLSPYNVLWGAGGPTIIDFPQIVSASHNSSSEQFFLRDADNILGHFARIDPSLQSRRGDPREIWNAYRRRELTPDFRPTGQTRSFGPPQRAHVDGRGDARRHDARADGHRPPTGNANGPNPPRPPGGPTHRPNERTGVRPPEPRPQPRAPQASNPSQARPAQQGRRPASPAQAGPRRSVHVPEVIVRHAVSTLPRPETRPEDPRVVHEARRPAPQSPSHTSPQPRPTNERPLPSSDGMRSPHASGGAPDERAAPQRRRRRRR